MASGKDIREGYEVRINKAGAAPYMADRLSGLQELQDEIDGMLKKHEDQIGDVDTIENSKFWRRLATAGAIATSIVAFNGLGLLPIIGAVMVMGGGLMAAGNVFGTVKTEYRQAHGSELSALEDVRAMASTRKQQTLNEIRQMPPPQVAGLLKLEEMLDEIPETRGILLQAFRKSVAGMTAYEQVVAAASRNRTARETENPPQP